MWNTPICAPFVYALKVLGEGNKKRANLTVSSLKKNEKLIYLIMRECKSGFTAQLSTMKNTLVNDLILQRYT
jgi:hypothetical protein